MAMRLGRFVILTIFGSLAGLVGGYIPAAVTMNVAFTAMPFSYSSYQTADVVAKLVWFAAAGAIVAFFQRATGPGALPRWWPLASAAGWITLIALASGARGSENNDLRFAIPAGLFFSLVAGGALLLRRHPAPASPLAEVRTARPPSRFSGFRIGALAVPAYLVFVGVGHTVLATFMSAQATGPRDGQAFSGTFVLGLMLVVVGLFALPIARERGLGPIVRSGVVGLVVAVAVVGYTYTRGYDVGGVAGERHCIVEQGREICPAGDGTYIKDARPDLSVILLGAVGAYALAHLLGRRAAVSLVVTAAMLLASCAATTASPGTTPFGSINVMERSLSANACRVLREPAAATLTPDRARFGLNGPNTAFGLAVVLDVPASDSFRGPPARSASRGRRRGGPDRRADGAVRPRVHAAATRGAYR
ncbi:MAG: hypothetical protein M3P16_07580 [Chloroflexota bacterium]|nr:hypothetical protein [Chloroflexota bacterium]